MDLNEQLRDPVGAALIAGALTAGYIHFRSKINNEGELPTPAYTKPALMNAILVYVIVSHGSGQPEAISREPF